MVRPAFSIALLSEDSSERTWKGLRRVVEKMLRRFEDDGFTPRVEIVPPRPDLRPVLIANRWRSTKPRDQADKRELWRYIARKIAEAGGFVFFHYDGDEVWSRRANSEAIEQFDSEVRVRVAQVLGGAGRSPAQVSELLTRLVECVPFYSVESWTYQATDRAVELCQANCSGAHVATFQSWAANRAALDDVSKPKDSCCLKDRHNDDLGDRVQVWEVVGAGRSLTAFAWNLYACVDLRPALAFPD